VALLIFTPLLVVKLSKSDGSQSIQALIIAERNAAEMIQQEETARRKRLDEIQEAAKALYATRRAEEQKKFDEETKKTEGDGAGQIEKLRQEAAAERDEQEKRFEAAKEDVVQMLLHYVTTCKVEITETQRQAFLAMARKEAESKGAAAE